jgi:signal transduction histidine kinase
MGIALTPAPTRGVPGDSVAGDALERLGWVWHALFAVTLGVSTGIALFSSRLDAGAKATVLVLAVSFALWHWLVLARHPQWWEKQLGLLTGYWVVAGTFAVVLSTLYGSFSILMYGLFPLMMISLGWWGIVPIVGLTAAMGWALGGWGSGEAFVTNLLTSAGLATLITVVVTAVSRQSDLRRDALAQLAATRAELAETARSAGVLAERERLARELHDTVAQGFISVVTQLESAEQALDAGGAAAIGRSREHLEKARHTARDSLAELRRSVRALRPDLLESSSLPQALQQAVQRWSAEHAVPAELRTTGTVTALHPDTELALLRIAQEALSNAGRHAHPSRVVVSLSYLRDTVTLDVDDDGAGFDGVARPHPTGGFGLVGMRERIEAVGGRLDVETAPGDGTTIAVSVPA